MRVSLHITLPDAQIVNVVCSTTYKRAIFGSSQMSSVDIFNNRPESDTESSGSKRRETGAANLN